MTTPEPVDPTAVSASGTYLRFDGMTWPNPADPGEVQWRLRYAVTDHSDHMVAASFMHAYQALVFMSERRRREIIRRLREGAELSRAEGGDV